MLQGELIGSGPTYLSSSGPNDILNVPELLFTKYLLLHKKYDTRQCLGWLWYWITSCEDWKVIERWKPHWLCIRFLLRHLNRLKVFGKQKPCFGLCQAWMCVIQWFFGLILLLSLPWYLFQGEWINSDKLPAASHSLTSLVVSLTGDRYRRSMLLLSMNLLYCVVIRYRFIVQQKNCRDKNEKFNTPI